MFTERDQEAVISVGKHKALSQPQIQQLHFPSYAVCQRRFRRELVTNDYLDGPFYWRTGKWSRLALYRLGAEGKKIFRQETDRDYRKPAWSENYIPHLLKVNRIILQLYDLVENLWLEWRPAREAKVQLDALLQLESGCKAALEVDIGEEDKGQIQNQFSNYQNELKKHSLPKIYIHCSNRPQKLLEWCKEVADKNLDLIPYFADWGKIGKLKAKLKGESP